MAIHPGRVRTCFVLLVLVGLTACVTPRQEGSSASYRHCASGTGCSQVEPVRGTQVRAPRGEVGPIQSELLDVDYFQGLLVRAGVPPEQLPTDKRGLSPVEADLEIHLDTVMAGVWAPDEDTVRPMLEGAGAAVVDTVTGLVTFILHPIDSLAGLAQLPGAVRTLIENSPEYWEQFRVMPHGAQVRAVSRLLTNVLITFGTAGVGSARVVSAGSRLGKLGVPILSLSAKGTLGMRLVAVPTGQLVTAIGPAVGGAYVLHMANMGGGGGGTPPGIRYFAEKEVADAMRVIFKEAGLGDIEIVHTRALPY